MSIDQERLPLNELCTQDMMLMLQHPDSAARLLKQPLSASSERLFRSLLDQHLNRLGLTTAEFGEKALLSRSFTYQIVNGTRLPGRDVVIRIAIALQLSVDDTQRMLRAAQRGALYPRVRRDAILISCLNQRSSLDEADGMLRAQGEEPLL